MRSDWPPIALSIALTWGCALDTEGLGTGNEDAGSAATAGTSAGTGGGGSGGVSGSAGQGGTSGSGAVPNFDGGTEDCLDGVDNDGNSLIDCADPGCAPGYQCVPGAPSPWSGYSRTRGDAQGAPAGPDCADGRAPTRYASSPAGPAQCEPCSCGPAEGGTCGAAPLLCYPGSSTCMGAASDWTSQASDGTCQGGSASVNTLSCKLGPIPLAAAGQCAASGGDFPNKEPFSTVTDVCRAGVEPGGGCGDDQVCVPRGAGDYAGYVCVEQPGEHECPPGWGLRIIAYTGANDARGCSPCSCSVPTAACTGAEYRFWDDPFCLIGSESVSSESCKDLTGLMDFDAWSFERSKQAIHSGTCAAAGGAPVGELHPTGALTFCCQAS